MKIKLFTALHPKLKEKGKSVCKSMEITLQINHIPSHLQETNDMKIWDNFMDDYKKTCPHNQNF